MYLLEEGSKVAGEASGLVNEQVIEVAISEKSLGISKEVVIEIDSVDHGVEALAESVVVVLKTNNAAEEEWFPRFGVDGSIINIDKSGSLSASCGIIIWLGALGLDTVGTTAHGVSEVSETVSVLTVKAHLNVTESVFSEVTVALNAHHSLEDKNIEGQWHLPWLWWGRGKGEGISFYAFVYLYFNIIS